MKFVALLLCALAFGKALAFAVPSSPANRVDGKLSLAMVKRGPMYTDAPPVNETNAYPTQSVQFYQELGCKGTPSPAFSSSANAAVKAFHPYINNLWSVKLCGQGSLFYYTTESMDPLSLVGHLTQCDVLEQTNQHNLASHGVTPGLCPALPVQGHPFREEATGAILHNSVLLKSEHGVVHSQENHPQHAHHLFGDVLPKHVC
eukprot:CAMPEP_0194484246 /NCGR_PEP_ID=MMETSP0253-20130528/5609_1 /TAXON_ID=2966 /ORGANISM="Noctiluca scintillans" /LENGTH=202 /DNA_ID=CAMNT_0039324015 /DNA_START=59 /DNA_END=666 /DNA_ORIENTATION=-